MADPELITSLAVALGAAGATRAEGAEELVRLSGGRRAPLQSARDHFVRRLHADVSDYEATKALQLVNAALSRIGWASETDG